MTKVRILSDRVANQIAAGEVIERPAAVVKELVENALDAGATRIEVEFRHGGRSLMRIEDNGSGMSKDDALLALERHATSKIAEAVDLDSLSSFGFRGEALPSIASVSRFELQTREAHSDVGVEVLVNGGKLVHVRDCGKPVGTRIVVTHLFHPVPARRKFLKTDATEAAHIVHGVRLYALAFPQVAFTLIEDGRIIFKSPQCATLEERVAEIFGRQIADGLVPISASEGDMKISGLIGRPGQGRSTRHEMVTYINQRPVDSRALNYALIESYHESLPKGRYPVAFVFFEINPAAVDVNVHPAKREVRFRNETLVRGFVIRAILARLRELGNVGTNTVLLPPVSSATPGHAAPTGQQHTVKPVAPMPAPRITPQGFGQGSRPVGQPPVTSAPVISRAPGSGATPTQGSTQTSAPISASAVSTPAPSPARSWRYLGMAHGSYVLFETAAGLVLMDRRATHERIWFERLRAQFQKGNVPSQRLLLPVPVELDAIASALLVDRLDFFNKHGFEVVEFGRNFFRIEGVPAWMEAADAETFVRDLLGALREGAMQGRNMDVARDELARLASARAIRLPDRVNETEMNALVTQLFACETPLTSPGGRPTYIEIGQAELARRFALR